jgi:glycosyltransferase involved in cell wall biosynthesis
MSKNVIIFQDGLLSYSETFIKKQAVALTQWQPMLVGHKYQKKGLPLTPLNHTLLLPQGTSLLRRLVYMINRRFNRADSLALQHLQSLNASLIHVHFGTSAVDFWPYAKALDLPMLVTLHGFDISIYKEWWESGKRGQRKRNYPAQLLALAQQSKVHFLAVSTAIKQRAIAFGIPEEKITLSYIGVDTDAFKEEATPIIERKNRILYVGRLVEKKGSSYLVDAFATVKAEIPDAELIIVGKGRLEEPLKQQISQLNLQGVTFAGALSNQEVKSQLDACKVFCLPSITADSGDAEGLPISILEAQASGVFVVSSSSGGVGDNLLEGETCFTFAEKDSDALAAILIRILKNPEAYINIIDQQKTLIKERFQLNDCAVKLEALYNKFGI